MRNMRRIAFSRLAGGDEASLHLHEVIGGRGAGPTIGISAAVHGDEFVGTQILMAMMRWLKDSDLKGRLLLLPVANPYSFEARTRHNPIDDLNLNRVFPGMAGGWFSEQLAHTIVQEFLGRVEVLIDLHAGGARPTVDYVYIFNDEQLSRSFGSKLLYRPDSISPGTVYGGTLSGLAVERGIPTVTLELGGGAIDQAPYVARGAEGLANALRALGVLPGEPRMRDDQIVLSRIDIIRPTEGGFLRTEAPPLGERIEEGAVLGRVFSPYTFDELEVMRNSLPNGWMVLAHLSENLVQPGDYAYMVGCQ
jgi:predicted deacylase